MTSRIEEHPPARHCHSTFGPLGSRQFRPPSLSSGAPSLPSPRPRSRRADGEACRAAPRIGDTPPPLQQPRCFPATEPRLAPGGPPPPPPHLRTCRPRRRGPTQGAGTRTRVSPPLPPRRAPTCRRRGGPAGGEGPPPGAGGAGEAIFSPRGSFPPAPASPQPRGRRRPAAASMPGPHGPARVPAPAAAGGRAGGGRGVTFPGGRVGRPAGGGAAAWAVLQRGRTPGPCAGGWVGVRACEGACARGRGGAGAVWRGGVPAGGGGRGGGGRAPDEIMDSSAAAGERAAPAVGRGGERGKDPPRPRTHTPPPSHLQPSHTYPLASARDPPHTHSTPPAHPHNLSLTRTHSLPADPGQR